MVERCFGINSCGFEGCEFGCEAGELACQLGLLVSGDVGGDGYFHRVLGPLGLLRDSVTV
ncbi:hypothetical protein [Mycobacteroides abscessus]|uniref:hypothetical protein n=1 Tax=Mycobacteroides abscessus TaxID=36809 RepID=UPI000C256A0F|nr:hypothetical protein [Mycobacteroides abscessus]